LWLRRAVVFWGRNSSFEYNESPVRLKLASR
jgi:hypothetical protein